MGKFKSHLYDPTMNFCIFSILKFQGLSLYLLQNIQLTESYQMHGSNCIDYSPQPLTFNHRKNNDPSIVCALPSPWKKSDSRKEVVFIRR